MQKIPTVFLRNPENMRELTRDVNPQCQWVLDGEGAPTRKYDGTCVMFDGERWWARREVKAGGIPPVNFELADYDPITEKRVGWEPIEQSSFWKIFQEAYLNYTYNRPGEKLVTGTYELCGPKINRNPEGYDKHELIKHSDAQILSFEFDDEVYTPMQGKITYLGIKSWILALNQEHGWEGIVWHHPDGRMAKLKARDYRLEKD